MPGLIHPASAAYLPKVNSNRFRVGTLRLLIVIFCLLPIPALPAGLGSLTVISKIGEPFQAEIPYKANTDEQAGLIARIASADRYAEQEIPYLPSLESIKVELKTKEDGTAVIRLSSSHPYAAPYPDLLVQIEWATGRSMRAYSAAPNIPVPEETPPAQIAELQPPSPEPESLAPSPEVAGNETTVNAAMPEDENSDQGAQRSLPKITRMEPVVKNKSHQEPPVAARPEFYVTKKGDTLYSIASRLKLKGISLEQMELGLFQENKAAFARQNMHQILAGKTIKRPDIEVLKIISQSQAVTEIKLHADDWDTYRMKLAVKVRSNPSATGQVVPQDVTGKIAAKSELMESSPKGPRDVIKLSAGNVGNGTSNLADPTSKIASLEDDLVAKSKALEEENKKRELLENQVQNMEKLLKLKNQLAIKKSNPPQEPPAVKPVSLWQKIATWLVTLGCIALAIWFALRLRQKKRAAPNASG